MSVLSFPTAEELSGPERALWIEFYMKSFNIALWCLIALHTRKENERFTRHVREWVKGERQGRAPKINFDQLLKRNNRRWSGRSMEDRTTVAGYAYLIVKTENFDFNFPLPRIITEFTPSR